MSNELVKYDHRLAYEYSLYEPYKYDFRLLKKIHGDLLRLALLKNEFAKVAGQSESSKVSISEAVLTVILNTIGESSLIIDAASNFIPEIVRDSELKSFLASLKLVGDSGIELNRFLLESSQILRFQNSIAACEGALAALNYQNHQITMIVNLNPENLPSILKVLKAAASELKGFNLILLNDTNYWKSKEDLKIVFAEAENTAMRFFEVSSANILEGIEVVKKFSNSAVNIISLDLNSEFELSSRSAIQAWLDPYAVFEHSLSSRGIISVAERDLQISSLRQLLENSGELIIEQQAITSDFQVNLPEGEFTCSELLLACEQNQQTEENFIWLDGKFSYAYLQALYVLSGKRIVLKSSAINEVLGTLNNNGIKSDFPLIILTPLSEVSIDTEAALKALLVSKSGDFYISANSEQLAFSLSKTFASEGINILIFNPFAPSVKISAAALEVTTEESAYLTSGQSATIISWGSSAAELVTLNNNNELDLEIFSVSNFSEGISQIVIDSIRSTGRVIICPDKYFGSIFISDLQNALALKCYQYTDAPVLISSVGEIEQALSY